MTPKHTAGACKIGTVGAAAAVANAVFHSIVGGLDLPITMGNVQAPVDGQARAASSRASAQPVN